jgi:hypothetical protein
LKEKSKQEDSLSLFYNAHPCFRFLKNTETFKFSEFLAKTNFKHKMVHPVSLIPIEIEATLELCTVYNGVPHGLAIINYDEAHLKFKGIGVFD